LAEVEAFGRRDVFTVPDEMDEAFNWINKLPFPMNNGAVRDPDIVSPVFETFVDARSETVFRPDDVAAVVSLADVVDELSCTIPVCVVLATGTPVISAHA
jgi:hypothetical protein